MVKRVEYDVYEMSDLVERALTIRDEDTTCSGGEWCPRCRLACAATQLTKEFQLPFDYADDMLTILSSGLPKVVPWTKEESDAVLNKRKSWGE